MLTKLAGGRLFDPAQGRHGEVADLWLRDDRVTADPGPGATPDAVYDVTLAFEGGKPADFKVPGHDSRLGQVVSNLIDNARSFSAAGGNVRVTVRRLKNEVAIVVDDDGPGIGPDALDKIFERFYTDRPNQSFGQNSGLGLSISKQIVEAHGGSIHAENRMSVAAAGQGQQEPRVLGARFVVRLPAK